MLFELDIFLNTLFVDNDGVQVLKENLQEQ